MDIKRVLRTIAIGVIVLAAHPAWAAVAQLTQLPVDALAVQLFTSLVNVWIPLVALLALIGLVVNMFVGIFQIGARLVGFVFGMALLAGGMPLLSQLFGGNLAQALILP